MEKEILFESGETNSKVTVYKNGSTKIEGASITIKEPSQLDRVENKVDRLLNILEDKELSKSFQIGNSKKRWKN